MKVATFNAASIRARLPIVLDWLATNEPDVLAVQETKVEDAKFPIEDFEEIGYSAAFHGQKAWNGVAMLSRSPLQNVQVGFGDELFPSDCRVISGELDGVPIVNTYVPNGNMVGTDKWDYKLKWLDRFRTYLEQRLDPSKPAIWLGDINIAPTPDDVYNSPRMLGKVGHHPDEFSRLKRIVEWGLVDCFRKHHSGPGMYTFWDFVIPQSVARNLGWRIDHIYATESLAAKCTSCTIDAEPRTMERPSDHTFVIAEFE